MSYIIALTQPDIADTRVAPVYLQYDVINIMHSGVAHCYNLEPREPGDPVQPKIKGMQVWYNQDRWSVITYIEDETR